eukprot:scaffold167447_cov33-Tisochrysis_lutea.AAC.4
MAVDTQQESGHKDERVKFEVGGKGKEGGGRRYMRMGMRQQRGKRRDGDERVVRAARRDGNNDWVEEPGGSASVCHGRGDTTRAQHGITGAPRIGHEWEREERRVAEGRPAKGRTAGGEQRATVCEHEVVDVGVAELGRAIVPAG